MSTNIQTALLSAFLSLFAAGISTAEDSKVGIGIMSGEPTGISIKHMIGPDTAVDAAVAWSFTRDFSLHVHADWLFHNRTFLKEQFEIETGEIPLYYGIGGRIRFDEDDDHRVGARFVVGISYIFDNAPFDIFLEVAPVLDLTPETSMDGNSAIGVRYWIP